MGLIGERGDAGLLDRAGDHHADVFAYLSEVLDQFGVAGVPAEAQAGEVGAFGK